MLWNSVQNILHYSRAMNIMNGVLQIKYTLRNKQLNQDYYNSIKYSGNLRNNPCLLNISEGDRKYRIHKRVYKPQVLGDSCVVAFWGFYGTQKLDSGRRPLCLIAGKHFGHQPQEKSFKSRAQHVISNYFSPARSSFIPSNLLPMCFSFCPHLLLQASFAAIWLFFFFFFLIPDIYYLVILYPFIIFVCFTSCPWQACPVQDRIHQNKRWFWLQKPAPPSSSLFLATRNFHKVARFSFFSLAHFKSL